MFWVHASNATRFEEGYKTIAEGVQIPGWKEPGSQDETVRVWDVQTGECQYTLEGHSDRIASVVFSPDGQLVASGSDDMTLRLWDIPASEPF